jgi:hypothetical protein
METVLQVEDKTRISASRSFVTNDGNITDVLIKPEGSESFISVFNSDPEKWYLEWAYITDGMKTVEVQIDTDAPSSRVRTYDLNVLSKDDDTLFSGDSDLIPYEPDVLKYLPKGKNTYLYAHRKAQEIIIAYLDEQRIWNQDKSRITKEQIAAITNNEIRKQFEEWSTFQTLLIIFESIQVSNEDIFQEKKINYMNLRNAARNRAALRLDLDGDEELETTPYDMFSWSLKRR